MWRQSCCHASFQENNKRVSPETVETVYRRFNGITWHMRKILNILFLMTPAGGESTKKMIEDAAESYDKFLVIRLNENF